MRLLLILIALFASEPLFGYSLWSVDRLDMDYYKYRPGMRDSYFVEEGNGENDSIDGYRPMQFQDGADLHMDLGVMEYLYWRNRFHMDEDEYKHVKHVGSSITTHSMVWSM